MGWNDDGSHGNHSQNSDGSGRGGKGHDNDNGRDNDDQRTELGKGGQNPTGETDPALGDSKDNDSSVAGLPDHIADYSNQGLQEDRGNFNRDFDNSWGTTKFGNMLAGMLSLSNPIAGMLSSFGWDTYSTRAQAPTESFGSYAGRMQAANASLGSLGSLGVNVAGGFLGAPRGAVQAGELLGDAVAGAPPGTLRTPNSNMQDNDSQGFLAPNLEPANQQPANTTPNYAGLDISGFLKPKKIWG